MPPPLYLIQCQLWGGTRKSGAKVEVSVAWSPWHSPGGGVGYKKFWRVRGVIFDKDFPGLSGRKYPAPPVVKRTHQHYLDFCRKQNWIKTMAKHSGYPDFSGKKQDKWKKSFRDVVTKNSSFLAFVTDYVEWHRHATKKKESWIFSGQGHPIQLHH